MRPAICLRGACLLLLGCGDYSPQTVPSGNVDSAVTQDKSPVADAGATKTSTPSVGPASAPAARPEKKGSGEPIAARRGLQLADWPDGYFWVLVKADVVEVAKAVAQKEGLQVVEGGKGQSISDDQVQSVVSQFSGHPWTIFSWVCEEPGAFVTDLSREMKTDVIMISFSDFTGWRFIDVYRQGESVESFHWGLDYSEELGKSPDYSLWDTHAKVTSNSDGISFTDELLFRSKLRKVTSDHLKDGDVFADDLLRKQDAYMPDTEELPLLNESGEAESPLGADAFAGVRFVIK